MLQTPGRDIAGSADPILVIIKRYGADIPYASPEIRIEALKLFNAHLD